MAIKLTPTLETLKTILGFLPNNRIYTDSDNWYYNTVLKNIENIHITEVEDIREYVCVRINKNNLKNKSHNGKSPTYDNLGTYSGCIDLRFQLEENIMEDGGAIDVRIAIYEGDNLNGFRKELRCTFNFFLTDNLITEDLMKIFQYAYKERLNHAYQEHLENQQREFMLNLHNQIFSKLS